VNPQRDNPSDTMVAQLKNGPGQPPYLQYWRTFNHFGSTMMSLVKYSQRNTRHSLISCTGKHTKVVEVKCLYTYVHMVSKKKGLFKQTLYSCHQPHINIDVV
jgi:hypothetical protein